MPSLHALCLNVLGSESDAADALQEALIAIYRGLPRYRGEARLSTWAYRITIRAALRHAGKRDRLPMEEFEDTFASLGDALTRARLKEIFAALEGLSPKHRLVLAMFALQGLSHEEIAEVLGIAKGTVWSRLHHARSLLTAELELQARRPAA